nr:NINJA1 [Lilium hybrid division VII]
MENEDGLELSLGLSFGGSSGKYKTNYVPPHHTLEEGNSRLVGGSMNISDISLQNTFERGENQDHDRKQKTIQNSSQSETFFSILETSSAHAAGSSSELHYDSSLRYRELWAPNNNTTDTTNSDLNKRKLPFDDTDVQRKSEKTSDYPKTSSGFASVRNSRVSATSEDGSVAENEDFSESEAKGSSSRLVSQCEDSSRSSATTKYTDKHVVTDLNGIDFQGQKLSDMRNKSKTEVEKETHLNPLSVPSLTVMPLTNREHPVIQTMNTGSLQLALGGSVAQLPTIDPAWISSSLPPHTTFYRRSYAEGAPEPDHSENASVEASHSSTVTSAYEKTPNLVEGNGKQVADIGISIQTGDKVDGNNFSFRPEINQPSLEGFPAGGSTIRPGIKSTVNFGGSGSHPDLPWVSTTGAGPNGKTISGVTYKYNKNQIKIVCACHGSHMSPEEFIQHAKAEAPNSDNSTVLS